MDKEFPQKLQPLKLPKNIGFSLDDYMPELFDDYKRVARLNGRKIKFAQAYASLDGRCAVDAYKKAGYEIKGLSKDQIRKKASKLFTQDVRYLIKRLKITESMVGAITRGKVAFFLLEGIKRTHDAEKWRDYLAHITELDRVMGFHASSKLEIDDKRQATVTEIKAPKNERIINQSKEDK